MKTFNEWFKGAIAEHEKLVNVSIYLNAAGRARLGAFDVLTDIAANCKTAADTLVMIYDDNEVTKEERAMLNCNHTRVWLWELQKIAEKEIKADKHN